VPPLLAKALATTIRTALIGRQKRVSMSIEERQRQFRATIESLPGQRPDARISENFGFSNSSRVIERGLFACTNNLQTYSKNLLAGTGTPVTQFIFLCVLTFPPQDEVYFAINVSGEASKINNGLVKLAKEVEERNVALLAAGKTAGSVNNNVKFYLTSGGNLYFHNNDFLNVVNETTLDPDCLAQVDAVWFSIWPPAVSASRSLLAREFVGYLGNLVGTGKVHEISVWPDASALSPAMRRMPTTISLSEIEAGIAALDGYYPNEEVRAYHSSLNFLSDKHFVILSGLSGTGKTRLALQYARAVHGQTSNTAPNPLLFVCSVRPEWTDPTGLTGYFDGLSRRYVVPLFLEALLVATAHRDSPVFVVLDELNLARVEYYLSDVLSCIETKQPLQLHAEAVPVQGTTGTTIPAALPIPPNLYITGTINIDETTHPVSDKVLDRAMVIDMSKIQLDGFLDTLAVRQAALAGARAAVGPRLTSVEALLAPQGLGFGYRTAEEVVRYHAFAVGLTGSGSDKVIDNLMVQKVLVKLRGGDRQRTMLVDLKKALSGLPRSEAMLDRLLRDLDEFSSFQASR
jgi:MoxR-like ATPase